MKKIILAVVALAVIGVGAYFALGQGGADDNTANVADSSANPDQWPNPSIEPEVTVNGTMVDPELINTVRNQIEVIAASQGADLSDPTVQVDIRNQAVETAVNTTLLNQAVIDAGIIVPDDSIEARLTEITDSAGGPEALANNMDESGLTDAELREDITQDLGIELLFEQELNLSGIVIAEDVIQSNYDETAAVNPDLPPLEEVRDELVEFLTSQEEQTLVNNFINGLREAADIQSNL